MKKNILFSVTIIILFISCSRDYVTFTSMLLENKSSHVLSAPVYKKGVKESNFSLFDNNVDKKLNKDTSVIVQISVPGKNRKVLPVPLKDLDSIVVFFDNSRKSVHLSEELSKNIQEFNHKKYISYQDRKNLLNEENYNKNVRIDNKHFDYQYIFTSEHYNTAVDL